MAGFYRKVFVYWGEGLNLSQEGIKVFDTDFGRIAVLTCCDLNFDELWQEARASRGRVVFFLSHVRRRAPAFRLRHDHPQLLRGRGRERKHHRHRPPRNRANFGTDLLQRQFIATLDLDRTLVHHNFSKDKVARLLREHPGREWSWTRNSPWRHGGSLKAVRPGIKARDLCKQYQIETLRKISPSQPAADQRCSPKRWKDLNLSKLHRAAASIASSAASPTRFAG